MYFAWCDREPAHRPREMHEVRLARGVQRVHAALLGQVIPLPRVAGAAGGHHVGPLVVAAARERNQVIPRQALAVPQLELAPVAVLAAVAVAGEEECVGDLATEAAGDVHELDQADDGWFGKCEAFTSDDVACVRLDDLGLALDDEPQGPADRHHGQRLERGVQRQAPHATSPQRNEVDRCENPVSLAPAGGGPTGNQRQHRRLHQPRRRPVQA